MSSFIHKLSKALGLGVDSSVPQGKNVLRVAIILKFLEQIVSPVIYLAIHNYLIAEMEDENVG